MTDDPRTSTTPVDDLTAAGSGASGSIPVDSLPLPERARPWFDGLAAGARAHEALPATCTDSQLHRSYFWLSVGMALATTYPQATAEQLTVFVAGAAVHQPAAGAADSTPGADPIGGADPGQSVAYVHPGDGGVQIATAASGPVLVHVHASSVHLGGWTVQIDPREDDPGHETDQRVEDCTTVYLNDGCLWDPHDQSGA